MPTLKGRIVTPRQVIPGAITFSERITSIEPGAGADCWIVPGFIDLQLNGSAGHDLMAGTPEAVEGTAAYHLPHGTTAFLPTLISHPPAALRQGVRAVVEARQRASTPVRLLGLHIEGPFLNPVRRGAHEPSYLLPPSTALMQELLDLGPVRLVTLAPELPGALELVRLLRRRGVIVSLGHSDANLEQTRAAIDAGVTMLTHFYNGMRGLHHRDPGPVGAGLTDDRLFLGLIPDLVHVHPVALLAAYRAAGPERICAVTDAVSPAGLPDGTYPMGPLQVQVRGNQFRLPDGTLAGSALTLDQAVRNLVYLGLPLPHAVQLVTLNPARAIGADGELGSLEIGKLADLVVLDNHLTVQQVIIGGQVAWHAG
ncbi:MAG: N-acetylglucosamine-6-phosphate deacetylase [Deinococcus sp.]|nr:N-acetylglucosamine-6-phosphate deacetylase [Deinococcus sp.]